jgi:hypothetical protein
VRFPVGFSLNHHHFLRTEVQRQSGIVLLKLIVHFAPRRAQKELMDRKQAGNSYRLSSARRGTVIGLSVSYSNQGHKDLL